MGQSPDSTEANVLRGRDLRYAALVENAPYCIHEIDVEGDLCSMNPAGLAMTGVEAECDVVGLHYLDIICEEDRPRIARLLADALAGKRSEFEFTSTNGRSFRSNFVPLPAADGLPKRLMGITIDLTESKALEREVQQNRRLDTVGRLAGGIAHDFNNLLSVILGAADLLRMRAVEGERRDLDSILTAAQRASDLTARLLAFSQRQMVTPKRIDVAQHLEATAKLLGRLLPVTVRLEVEATPGLVVSIDRGQLDEVLVNLITNARDALPSGGRIDLGGREVRLD